MRKHLLYSLVLLSVIGMTWGSVRAQAPTAPSLIKLDPSFDQLISSDAKLELLQGEGAFEGGEGPLWIQRGDTGYLLFSDVSGNRIFQWTPDCFQFPCKPGGNLSVYSEHSGYIDAARKGSVDAVGAHLYGSNGLTLDREGRILLDANGDRAVERLEKDGQRTTLADRFEGKRLTCPNDIVIKSDGAVYFTDGMAGCLPKKEDDPAKELPFHGVYFVRNGSLQLLDKDPGNFPPNGLAFSPDEKILYVNNGGPDPNQRQIFAYDVQPDGTVKNRRLFIDFTGEKGPGGPDGMKVDVMGNLYSTGMGGVWVISPAGKRLGKIPAPEGMRFSNLTFGDQDSKTLYIVSSKTLWRIRLKVAGLRPVEKKR
ncbi:MAG TPA: SMP-30/gluconolactonase/LRE family protein [Candidatus Saccharimonadales bacterium]|jgi:gluconolactonase|nr:SMP-30/gluconolactonase/LRE family protein [Candidatus Saccharimonadales bacterium]